MPREAWVREIVRVVGIALVLGVVAIFIYAHAGAAHIAALTGLGATLGVVYTAGGLVIVAVAVFSLSLIPRTVEQEVNKRWPDMRSALEHEIKMLVPATSLFIRAQWEQGKPEDAEKLIVRALKTYESLAGARIWLAREYHHAAKTRFYAIHATRVTTHNLDVVEEPESVAKRGLEWLTAANECKDGRPVEIIAMEAEMLAMLRSRTSTVRGLLRRLKHLNETEEEPVQLDPLIMLHLFGESESMIHELERLLDITILLAPSETVQRLQGFAKGADSNNIIYAILKPGQLPALQAISPCTIHLDRSPDGFLLADWPCVSNGRMSWVSVSPGDEQSTELVMAPQQLADELLKKFWLLTGDWPEPTTYRDEPPPRLAQQVQINEELDFSSQGLS